MCGILETLCSHQKMVPIQNGYHGPAFSATSETIQVGLVSPILFNLVVDNVIQKWLTITVEYQRLAHDGLVGSIGW